MTIKGTAGDDTLTGTSGNDSFDLSQGGNDTVSGLGGNDIFKFGATLTAADSVNGGSGSDTVVLDGDYSGGVTLGADTLVSVEKIDFTAGFDYELATNDANVAAGAVLTLNASSLGAGNTLFFDGSAETNGYFVVEGGAGADTITLGAALVARDRIDGGSGDDTMYLSGDYSLSFGKDTLRDISDLVLFGGHDYRFATNDGNVAAGATMNVDANSLESGDTLDFNGSRETDGNFNFDSGQGLMELTGGAGDDVFFMGSRLTAADRIDGGAGSDVVYLGGGDYNLTMNKATLQSVENLKLSEGYNYHLVTGGGIATDATMVVDATAVTADNSVYFDAAKETQGSVVIDGGTAASTLIGTQQGDAFDFSVSGQAGLTASDSINGEGGYDRLYLDGDYTGANALNLTNTTVTNVEEFDLGGGFSYILTLAAKTVAAGASLKIDASALTSSNILTFDGSAAHSTTSLQIIAGEGNDTLTGGAGNDTFTFGANLTAADSVNGGGGSDVLSIDGYYMGDTTLVFGAATMTNIGELLLGNSDPSYCYDITTVDANVAAGKTLTVDAANLTSSQSLTFNGSAETDGHFFFEGGADSDTLTGGALSDTFYYSTAIGVTGALRDTINAFDFANDVVEFAAVDAIGAAVNVGAVNEASIDADFSRILTAARLPAHDAILFTPTGGNLAGHTFLVVDGNGTAGYQTGSDLVIELSGALHTASISTANFTA